MTKLKIPAGFKVVTPPPGTVIIMLPARMINGKLDTGSVEELLCGSPLVPSVR